MEKTNKADPQSLPSEERRYVALESIELREMEGRGPILSGYAVLFNTPSSELPGGFTERVMPGAFARSIAEGDDVLARGEHQDILGRISNGTLRLFEDERGLRYEIDPPNTNAGRDMVELVRRRDIAGSSFAFTVRRPGGEAWRREDGKVVRELRSVKLIDVAPVSRPAYPKTEIALRSMNEWQEAESVVPRMEMKLALAERV